MAEDSPVLQPVDDHVPASPISLREPGIDEFLASHGGPFYKLQARLRLLRQNALQSGRRAVVFVSLAWGVPFLLGLPGSLSLDHAQGAWLTDPGAWTKFFVAILAFTLAEQQVERGLRTKLRQLVRAPLVAPTSMAAAAHAVAEALRRRDSPVAEAVCVALAFIASLASYANFHTTGTVSWAVRNGPDGNSITLAGWWAICVSLPLFTFLFLRGVWRHLVWARMLRRIARLELRLVAAHPDGKGGIGFLALYPNAYMLFVLGISSAAAAAMMKHGLQGTFSMTTFGIVMGGWLAFVTAFFAYPLSAFSKPLARLKAQGLLLFGTQATIYHRSAERKVAGRNVFTDPTMEPDSDIADPTKLFETSRKLSTILVSRRAIVPVAAAALVPFAAAGATRLPYKEVFSVLKKLLLL